MNARTTCHNFFQNQPYRTDTRLRQSHGNSCADFCGTRKKRRVDRGHCPEWPVAVGLPFTRAGRAARTLNASCPSSPRAARPRAPARPAAPAQLSFACRADTAPAAPDPRQRAEQPSYGALASEMGNERLEALKVSSRPGLSFVVVPSLASQPYGTLRQHTVHFALMRAAAGESVAQVR